MSTAIGTRMLGSLVRALQRDGSVLCFHGLREDYDAVDSTMNMTLAAFEAAIELVRASAAIVPLEDLHRRWSTGQSTRGLVAITFDDAYVSLLETAPRWYIPAPFPITVFVVTGASERGEAFWWDRVESLSGLLSREDRIVLEEACGVPLQSRGQVHPVHGALRGLRQWVLEHHAGRAPLALSEALSRMEVLHGRCTLQRAMSVEELRRMAMLGPVTFGVHSMSHPVFPLLPTEEAAHEIRQAWASLQSWGLAAAIPYFAVPFGLLDSATPRLGARCGMKATLMLNDRTLWRRGKMDYSQCVPRLSIGQGSSPLRIAYRLSGMRDIVQERLPLASTSPIRTLDA